MKFSICLLTAALLIYSSCFLPQLWMNYKLKSTLGMSDLFIWCYFTGYMMMLPFIFLQSFAVPYRIIIPIEVCLMTFILVQRFYYDGFRKSLLFSGAIIASTAFFLGLLIGGYSNPVFVGVLAGWLAFALFSFNQIPQLFKLWRKKSVHGFSFGFVSLTALAQACELIGGLIEGVPLPTILMAVRGLAVYGLYVYFFWHYKKNKDEKAVFLQ